MNGGHPTQEQLAGFAMGGLEEAEQRRLADHVRGCEACAGELEQVREALREIPPFPVPEARADAMDATWRTILSQVEDEAASRAAAARAGRAGAARAGAASEARGQARHWLAGPAVSRWAARAAQVVVLLALGFALAWFAAGRGWLPGIGGGETRDRSRPGHGIRSGAARGSLATSGYGDRLETLLVGLSGGDSRDPTVTPAVREAGRELLEDSRWYRQAAARSGDASLEDLLARVETLLVALVTVPEGQEQRLVEGVRTMIEEDDLLWRLRAVRQSVPAPGRRPAAGRGS